MKRSIFILLLVTIGLQTVTPALARVRRVVVRPGPRRTTVVVTRGWPIRRPARVVVVHPVRHAVLITPSLYLAPVFFAAAMISMPPHNAIVWEDAATISRDDDWTEFTLNVGDRGRKLFMQVDGKAQVDWAEVVFANGDAQVVDFKEQTPGPGSYGLLDFADGRRVDHVRVVARAKTPEAKFVLRMEKA
jgi:hypothetical protein